MFSYPVVKNRHAIHTRLRSLKPHKLQRQYYGIYGCLDGSARFFKTIFDVLRNIVFGIQNISKHVFMFYPSYIAHQIYVYILGVSLRK